MYGVKLPQPPAMKRAMEPVTEQVATGIDVVTSTTYAVAVLVNVMMTRPMIAASPLFMPSSSRAQGFVAGSARGVSCPAVRGSSAIVSTRAIRE